MSIGEKISEKNWLVAVLAVIVFVGGFLRFYHFSDWMHFELDQARDALVVSLALEEGPSKLPLLGPKARGSYLRLGPAFYNLEYLSAKIFGGSPSGMAFFIPILGTASIALFYFFVKIYFDFRKALALTLVFSSSLFLIIYSRFAWNPNPLPFFGILFLWSLLESVSLKNSKTRRGYWLMTGAFSLAIASQLHFLAFLLYPAVALVFLIFKRPQIEKKFWLYSLLIIIFFYLPVVINEAKTGGKNAQAFFQLADDRSGKSSAGVLSKFFIDCAEHSRYYFLTISSHNFDLLNQDGPVFSGSVHNLVSPDIPWEKKAGFLLAVFLFAGGFLWLARGVFREKEGVRRDFLLLLLIAGVFQFALFFLLASDLSARFFLLFVPLPFVFLGLVLENFFVQKTLWFSLVCGLFFAANLLAVRDRFWETALSQNVLIASAPDPFLNEKARVTLGQEKALVDFMIKNRKNAAWPIYFIAPVQYIPALEYLLEEKGVSFDNLNKKEAYLEGTFYYITIARPQENEEIKEFQKKYEIAERKNFGTLTILILSPKPEAIAGTRKKSSLETKRKKDEAQERFELHVGKRYTWGEIF